MVNKSVSSAFFRFSFIDVSFHFDYPSVRETHKETVEKWWHGIAWTGLQCIRFELCYHVAM